MQDPHAHEGGPNNAAALLTFKDHAKVVEYLVELTDQEIIEIGVMLGLHPVKLKNMSHESLLNGMVHSWLRKDDSVVETSGPSWKILCTALKECGFNGIALRIEKKEVHQAPPSQGLPQPQEGSQSEFSEDFDPQQLYSWLMSHQLPETDCRKIQSQEIRGTAFKLITDRNGWEEFGLSEIAITIINLLIKKQPSSSHSVVPDVRPLPPSSTSRKISSGSTIYEVIDEDFLNRVRNRPSRSHSIDPDVRPLPSSSMTRKISSGSSESSDYEVIDEDFLNQVRNRPSRSPNVRPLPPSFVTLKISSGSNIYEVIDEDFLNRVRNRPRPASLTAGEDVSAHQVPSPQQQPHEINGSIPLEYSSGAVDLSRSENEFWASIEKHIQCSGMIDRFLAHLVFVGFPASGKTTLRYRLLDLVIDFEASSSTGVMDGIITVSIGGDKSSKHAANVDREKEKCLWSEVNFSLSCLRQMGMLPSQPSHTLSHLPQHRENTEPALSDRDPATSDRGPTSENSQPMEVVLKTIQETLKEKGYSAEGFHKVLPYLNNKTTLYLSDTGGQIEFQELLPLLVAGCAIFLFLFPLNKDLKEPVQVSYRKEGGGRTNVYTSSLTIEESLLQTLSSIDSMCTSKKKDESSLNTELQHKPAVFVIGTHKDCLIEELGEAAADKIEAIDNKIDELITKHKYDGLVKYADPDSKKLLFAVDNTNKNDNVFQKIRTRILEFINKEEKFHITFPLSYLLASMHLDSVKEPFIKRSDFIEYVKRYLINEKDVNHLLRFLHTRIGQIRYFSDVKEIEEDIVKEPQALYDIVTHLITESFLSSDDGAQDSEVTRGIYSLDYFKKHCDKHSEILGLDKIIALLKRLRIVAPFFDQKAEETKFFIPCVIHHRKDPPKEDTSEASSIQPLAVVFDSKHCPKGMFGVLIHYLLTQDTSSSQLAWSLSIEKIFRGQVSFEVGYYKDEVTIRFHTAYIEVKYHPKVHPQRNPEFTEKKICNMIRSVLDSGIEQSIVSLRYSPEKTKYKFGLVCVKCCSAHEVIKGDCSMICPKRKTVVVPNPGSYWFEMPTFVLKDEVTLKEGCGLHKIPFSVAPIDKSSLKLSKDPRSSTDSQVHVKLNSDLTVCFENLKKKDEGMYKISGRNEHGCAEISFQLSVIGPTKYKFLQRYLKGVAGSSSTLEFSVDPPVPEDTEHFLRKENGEAAPPWFEVKYDRIIFQDLEEGDKGKYIISCHDTEGELVEETLWLKVESSQPSALAAHGAPAHQPPTHQHHDNAQGYYPTPHNHPPPRPPRPPGMYYPPYGQQSQCPPPWQGPPPHQQWGYFQEPAASSYGAHNEFHQAPSPESHPTLVESCHIGCLMEQLMPCLARWERIADGLRFTSDETATISRAESMKSLDSCLRAVLAQWMCWDTGDARGSSGRATLEALKTAVKNAGYPKVANSLTLTH